MPRLTRVLYMAALLAFGATLPGSVQAMDPEADRCPGLTAPVCSETTVSTCTRWYWCNFFQRCCRDTEDTTRFKYFPTLT